MVLFQRSNSIYIVYYLLAFRRNSTYEFHVEDVEEWEIWREVMVERQRKLARVKEYGEMCGEEIRNILYLPLHRLLGHQLVTLDPHQLF